MSGKKDHKIKTKLNASTRSLSNYNKKHLLHALIETNCNLEKQAIVFGRFDSVSRDPTEARSLCKYRKKSYWT